MSGSQKFVERKNRPVWQAGCPKVSRALMAVRNMPDRDTRLSPAQSLLGRNLRDFLLVHTKKLMGQRWGELSEAREIALAKRNMRAAEE